MCQSTLLCSANTYISGISVKKISHIVKLFIHFIKREKIHKVLIAAIAILLFGSTLLMTFEKNIHFQDALWWSIVTMTTVGYGDISPATPGGRAIAIVVMLSGIGAFGFIDSDHRIHFY